MSISIKTDVEVDFSELSISEIIEELSDLISELKSKKDQGRYKNLKQELCNLVSDELSTNQFEIQINSVDDKLKFEIQINSVDDKLKFEHIANVFHKYTCVQIEKALPI